MTASPGQGTPPPGADDERTPEQTRAVDLLHEFVRQADRVRSARRVWLANDSGLVSGVALPLDTLRSVAALLPPTPPKSWSDHA